MASPTCFGITLPSSWSVTSAFWEMLIWGAIYRILWMGVLCLVTRASIPAWARLILFANTFCRSAFGKSLRAYESCWKWCPRASIKAWTRLIYRSVSAQRLFERTVYCFSLNFAAKENEYSNYGGSSWSVRLFTILQPRKYPSSLFC
jgi:hypothetical protein